jgi:hypothetical protein
MATHRSNVGDRQTIWQTFGGRYRQGDLGQDGWSAAASFFRSKDGVAAFVAGGKDSIGLRTKARDPHCGDEAVANTTQEETMLKVFFPLVVGVLASLFVYVIWLWVQKLQGSVGAIVLRGVVFGVWESIAAIVIFTIYMGAKYPGGIALDVRGPAWMAYGAAIGISGVSTVVLLALWALRTWTQSKMMQ